MIAHIDLDSFFVAVERARHPELVGRPIVIGGHPGSHGLVATVSREARRAGIRPGTSLAEASIRCPDAVFLDGAFDAYLAASLDVDEVLRRVSSTSSGSRSTRPSSDFHPGSRRSVRSRPSNACTRICVSLASTPRSGLAARGPWRAWRRGSRARAAWCTSSTDTRRASFPSQDRNAARARRARRPAVAGRRRSSALVSSRVFESQLATLTAAAGLDLVRRA